VELSEIKVQAFKIAVPTMVEGKTCELPERYVATVDTESTTWMFDFELGKPCKGKWRVSLGFDNSVNVEQR